MKGWTTIALLTTLAAGGRDMNSSMPGGRAPSEPTVAIATALRFDHASIAAGGYGLRLPGSLVPAHRPVRPRMDARSHRFSDAPAARGTAGVVYCKRTVGSTAAHVVSVDLNRADIHVTVRVASGGIGRCESWKRIINRLRPTAAITGTYYDPATFIPVGTIIAEGVVHQPGTVGTALTLTSDNRCRFVRGRLPLAAPGSRTTLRAGPRLVDQGQVSLMPREEGFHDPGIMVRKPRAAVGLTRANKLLLVTVTRPLFLREMAKVMLALGAENAMCMDGGSSTGLYYGGKSYQVPQRVMTNVLVVYAGTSSKAVSS
jgi:hypothetical protein